MINKKLLCIYFTFLLSYYMFIVKIPCSVNKTFCLFEGNSFYNLTDRRHMTINMVLVGIINSVAIAYITSLISQLKIMDVYIRNRLNRRKLTGFYYSSILGALVVIYIPKFLIDLIMTEFNGLWLVLFIQVNLFFTLLLYAMIYSILLFSGCRKNMILFFLITLNFVASMIHLKPSIFSLMIFCPHTLYEFDISVLLIKVFFVLMGVVLFWLSEEKFVNNLL